MAPKTVVKKKGKQKKTTVPEPAVAPRPEEPVFTLSEAYYQGLSTDEHDKIKLFFREV